MRRLAWALLALAAGTAPAAAQGNLNLYCATLVEWCQAMANGFQAATGTHVALNQKSTGEMMAQVRAEAQNPRGDVWWAGQADPHLAAAEAGLTQDYRPAALDDLQPWARQQWEQSKGRAVGVAALAIGIGWNRELLAKKGAPPPACWADLLKADYRNEIQMPNPNSSGTAYTVIATLVQLMGEEPAFGYLKALHANVNSYPRSGVAPTRAIARGETAVAIGFLQGFMVEQLGGFPVEMAAPCEGTALGIDSMSIIRGARNLAAARRFYDWALTPEAQALGERIGQLHLPSNRRTPLPKGTPDFGSARVIDYDFARFGQGAERARLLGRWDREIGALPR
ncbi:MAG: ABC transporter substrate-binding protein [Alphaproteobacteria bacterium]